MSTSHPAPSLSVRCAASPAFAVSPPTSDVVPSRSGSHAQTYRQLRRAGCLVSGLATGSGERGGAGGS